MSLALAAVLVASFVVLVPGTAQAETPSWATWEPITGSSNNYETRMQMQSPGFPGADVATDSRGNVQLPSGKSTFLGADTPPGAEYGSSKNSKYLNLRPKADRADAPSTTTYTFDDPTPMSGWAFVLGDIDADMVQVKATDENGDDVPAATIAGWFQGTFNHAGGDDEPSWNPVTSTLTGNAGAIDTNGASGWFEPNVSLSSLSFVFTQRSGFPVYQTWFASLARPIGGTVTDVSTPPDSCPVEESVLTLVSPHGEELATTSPDPDGNYSFGEFATQAGYTVRIEQPDGCAPVGETEVTVDNTGEDDSDPSRGDFEVRQIIPEPISGTVRDDDGNPVPGVTVTLTDPDGNTKTTTTTTDGGYLFDENEVGEGYSVSIDVPDGYEPGPDGDQIDDINVEDEPVTDQDFVIVQHPSVSGQVVGGGNPLGGVQVTLTPSGGGAPITTVTDGDGNYVFDRVPPGDYTIEIDPPDGFDGETSRDVTVADQDVPDQDFELTRPGAIGGQVTDDAGDPVSGVDVTIDGPDGPQTVTTDDEGRYFVEDLPPGDYTITITNPDGSKQQRTVTITEDGEIFGSEDFQIEEEADEPTPPPADPDKDPGPSGKNGDGPASVSVVGTTTTATALPDTGGPQWALVAAGAGLLLLGGGLAVTARGRSGRANRG